MTHLILQRGQEKFQTEGDATDLSIPMRFDGPQPGFFGADAASSRPMHVGEFIGDTRLGGSCNAEHLDLTPHCNGTHTECVGHITNERVAINEKALAPLYLACLLSIEPCRAGDTREQGWQKPRPEDRLLTESVLKESIASIDYNACDALIVRTLPNEPTKCEQQWTIDDTPYFSVEAMRWIVKSGFQHLLVDIPSVDRLDDSSLDAHRIFWGMHRECQTVYEATRPDATITEMIYVPEQLTDGNYLLALQIAPLVSDAAPSRPLLYRIK